MAKSFGEDLKAHILIVSVYVVILSLLFQHAAEPYMDEIFHVPQFKRVHAFLWNNAPWEWDPAITTFPGLYLVSSVLTPIDMSSINEKTLTMILRCFNAVIFTLGLYWVCSRITKSSLGGLIAVFYPLNFFYSFLYYTDLASTVFVLITAHLLLNEKRFVLSGITALLAVLMRQTNIVWIFGFCLTDCMRRIGRERKVSLSVVWSILRDLWIHIILGFLFAAFVIKNNYSVVLGHHEQHGISLHFAQITYFVLTVFGACGPGSWADLPQVFHIRLPKVVGIIVLLVMASEFGTIAHPFILSDNRHYSFYFFRYFVSRRWVRSILFPIAGAVILVTANIFQNRSVLPKWILWLCTLMCIVPSPLIEFRYFNIPATLLLCGDSSRNRSKLIFFIAVNAVTLYVYIYRPFVWGDGTKARFMY